MHAIRLKLKERSYDIVVGTSIIRLLGRYIAKLRIGRTAYVITNVSIKNKYGGALRCALKDAGFALRFKTVPDTEKSKSIEVSSAVINDIARYDKRKQLFIVAFGGGVIGDLSGFIASIYKRGVPYVQVPTTLLAQVDSAIGGKTAVDLCAGKNLIGAFYQPKLVFSDVGLLASLGRRQIRAGLSEVIKYGIIKDARLFSYLEKRCAEILRRNPSVLEDTVKCCSRIKADIVQRDEREERGIRTILNFGHTVGHAIEAASGYKTYNHGEAVALGMLVAADISRALGLLGDEALLRIENLIRAAGLPTRIKNVSLRGIIEAHYRDKKFIGRKNRLVLIEGIGSAKIVEDVPLRIIEKAIVRRIDR